MPRLYDEILDIASNDDGESEYMKSLKESLPLAQVFMASNVHKLIDPNGSYFASKDFPNAAPPFDVTWVEWSVEQDFADSIDFSELRRCGTLTQLCRTDDGFSLCMYGILDMRPNDDIIISVFPGKAHYSLDELGNVVDHYVSMPSDPRQTGGMVPEAIDGLIIPTLLTFSLLNCRNVVTKEQTPHNGEIKRWKRRGKVKPLCRYQTLDVSTMARVLCNEGNMNKNGPAKALHVCRGHFKDYTKNGLFGKYKGLFYFGPIVRGGDKMGMVLKDYNVEV